MLEDKVRSVFADMVVLKDPKRTEYFSKLSLPSYMRDWLVMKFSDEEGEIDYEAVRRYIDRFIPNKGDYEQLKYRMINGDTVQFLARLRVGVDIRHGRTVFELPDLGGIGKGAGGVIPNAVMDRWHDVLLRESENWGIMTTIWQPEKKTGVINMTDYRPFCPYQIDLEEFKQYRAEFDIHEWIDVIMNAIDYNPNGFVDEEGNPSEYKKLIFLRRLLPFVERRVNMIELAPKGTGKSYVFEKISKRGWLISGGTVSRASLIYDNGKKNPGLLARYDYVGFDEVQSITFSDPGQIQQALKHYMEFGEIKGFDAQIPADAGVIVLGNINADRFDTNTNMVENISSVFGESATLDRFHGFIPGWEIPRMNSAMIARGWAINTEYFSEVLHTLREDLVQDSIVEASLNIPKGADQRDLTAIKRLCTALVKLLYPHASRKEDIPPEEFIHYCLEPAKEMRAVIKKQLCIIDPKEFDVPGKNTIPDIQYRE